MEDALCIFDRGEAEVEDVLCMFDRGEAEVEVVLYNFRGEENTEFFVEEYIAYLLCRYY